MNRTALCWKSSARLWGSSRFPLLMIQHRDFSKEMPAIRLHPYNRLKDIAKLLKVPFAKIEKKLVVKRRKQYFCKFDGAWFSFPSTNAIIVPFGTARLLATKHGRAAELIPLMERGAGKRADRLPVLHISTYND